MAKPFIRYALVLVRQLPRVLGVTSEARRILYGRWLDTDDVTNVSERDLLVRYDSAAPAEAAVMPVEHARREWDVKVSAARQALDKARASRKAAMLAAAQPCAHPGEHIISDQRTSWCDLCRLPVSGDLTQPYGDVS